MSPPPPPPPPSSSTAEAKADWTVSGSAQGGFEAQYRIVVPGKGHWIKRLLGFMGPGYLVAVGYMDPGNWATDLAGGSAFGYALLWVIMLSNAMAIVLQVLSARLGIVTGMDLAQACRHYYSRPSAIMQWLICEIAICACDMAEVIGTAIALNLLFHISLIWGVSLTILDVLLVLWLQQRGYRYLEALIMAMLLIVFFCFAINLVLAKPVWGDVASGFLPTSQAVSDSKMLYLIIGIIGATVMPHNLYLHSSTVQTRHVAPDDKGKQIAVRYATIDVIIALMFACIVNAAILITAAAVFHQHGHRDVAEIQNAYYLLTPLLGTSIASFLFGLALLVSGQSSTLTATLAGQIVMEGYMHLKMPAWARRLLTRAIAIVPALFAASFYGESGIAKLLIFSQVVLSMQLPFAIIPLVRFTSDRTIMGNFVSSRWLTGLACSITAGIIFLNALMISNELSIS
jgi:manganese transport protein